MIPTLRIKNAEGESPTDLLVAISERSQEIEPNIFILNLLNLGTSEDGSFAILCSFHCNNSPNLVRATCCFCYFCFALVVVDRALYLRVVFGFILEGVPG